MTNDILIFVSIVEGILGQDFLKPPYYHGLAWCQRKDLREEVCTKQVKFCHVLINEAKDMVY